MTAASDSFEDIHHLRVHFRAVDQQWETLRGIWRDAVAQRFDAEFRKPLARQYLEYFAEEEAFAQSLSAAEWEMRRGSP